MSTLVFWALLALLVLTCLGLAKVLDWYYADQKPQTIELITVNYIKE